MEKEKAFFKITNTIWIISCNVHQKVKERIRQQTESRVVSDGNKSSSLVGGVYGIAGAGNNKSFFSTTWHKNLSTNSLMHLEGGFNGGYHYNGRDIMKKDYVWTSNKAESTTVNSTSSTLGAAR
ncbi:transcriptional factor B3 family protein /auxin-responsive factor AUX/IAA-related [Striga asiatica]|uniref:Transcriptional factor B3 family protein /auxin-responsive factor AUX/IAA-related n=1 Tax=Striga asiatica TaxID=4170 RepID=A0A5A7PK14_STRAF|nr:transcriptional factor B3 family protein /auxin-responsive factor AUX/IAA-related [Striga asiatica]